MRIGLSYTEALDIPIGELRDYIAIEQIKCEDMEWAHALTDEDTIPPHLSGDNGN